MDMNNYSKSFGVISHQSLNLLLEAFKFIKPYRYRFLAAIMSKVAALVLITIQPLLFGGVVDGISKSNTSALYRNILLMFIVFISSTFFSFINRHLIMRLAVKVESDVRNTVFESLLKVPMELYDSIKKGEIIVKLDEDVRVFTDLLINKLSVIIDIGSVFVVGAILLNINWILTLVLLVTFPINLMVFLFYGKKIKIREKKLKEERDSYFTFLQEILNGFKSIKIFEAEKIIRAQYVAVLNNIYSHFTGKILLNNFASTFSQLSNYVGYLLILSLGAWQISLGNLTLGKLVAFNTYSGGFNNSLMRITQLNSQLQETIVSLQRIFALIHEITNFENKSNVLIDNDAHFNFKQNIQMKNILFKYKNSSSYILNGISITFPKNKMTAIMGPSGSGKTTLINLLSGLYHSYNGEIYAGGIEYKSIPEKKIIENIVFVTQENFFISGSIKENIMISKPEASDNEIIEACKRVYMHDFIWNLPDKYDTYLGSNGIDLSIGQKQRLSIARALLKKASVYLFDEITSSLDGHSEKYISMIMKELSRDHTVIAVSHRLSTVDEADQYILVDSGKVVGVFSDKKELFKGNRH